MKIIIALETLDFGVKIRQNLYDRIVVEFNLLFFLFNQITLIISLPAWVIYNKFYFQSWLSIARPYLVCVIDSIAKHTHLDLEYSVQYCAVRPLLCL